MNYLDEKSAFCWITGENFLAYKSLRKKVKFSIKDFFRRIFSVNVTKSAVSCGFGHIYRKNP